MTGKEHPILETHPHLREFMAFLDHLNAESERGQVLISATVDDILQRTVAAFLIQGGQRQQALTGFNAPLGTFSARIQME